MTVITDSHKEARIAVIVKTAKPKSALEIHLLVIKHFYLNVTAKINLKDHKNWILNKGLMVQAGEW